jgi:hypothetical protein
MRTKIILLALAACALAAAGCRGSKPSGDANASAAGAPVSRELPESGFRAQITVADPPARLRAGQKETVNVKVKNVSDVTWPSPSGEGPKYVVAAGNSWIDKDGVVIVPGTDGRYGIQRELPPGEEEELPLVVTAPKEPGEYTLEIDLLQEQVSWFKDKGSETYKVKVKVE